jgi:hypothetical protein
VYSNFTRALVDPSMREDPVRILRDGVIET